MDFLFLLFIFLAAVGIVGSSYFLYSGGRPITTFILFGGSLTLTIVYGLKWFRSDGTINLATPTVWPPVINVCPDFLSVTKIGGRAVCVDTIGVSPIGGLQKNDGTLTAANTIFDLKADISDSVARTKALCDLCREKKLTWEGVFDGSICIGGQPPTPPA
jgi:hypothetical protein